MTEILISPVWLILLFFFIALAYSSVGLGGGSTYTATMAIVGVASIVIPMVSLALNVIVTSIGSINFIRNGHARWKLVTPFLVSSIPMAWLGGSLAIDPRTFYYVLLGSLLFVAARIYLWDQATIDLNLGRTEKLLLALVSGAVLGLVAGIAGIGGGIYLVPLIIILGLGSAREAAACGAIFIWLNSVAGLLSRWQFNPVDLTAYLPLILAVAGGGFVGSRLGSSRLSAASMERILGVIVLIAIGFLVHKLWFVQG